MRTKSAQGAPLCEGSACSDEAFVERSRPGALKDAPPAGAARLAFGEGFDQAAAQFGLVVESVPGLAFFTIDIAGHVQTWSASAEHLTGARADEVVGRDFSTFLTSCHVQDSHSSEPHTSERLLLGELQDAVANGSRQTSGLWLCKDGRPIEVEVTIIPTFGECGETQGFIGILRDVTAQKTAERELAASEAGFRALVETAVDAIIVIDEEGFVQSFNGAAERAFGYAAAEIVGQSVRKLMPEPHRSRHDGYLARYRQSGEARIIGRGREVDARRKNGEIFPVELAIAEWADGGRRRFTGILRDITERKRAEERLNLIMREQSHRMKNLFAVVQAMAWQTARSSADVRDFDRRFTSRLQAMARSYDLLVKGEWRSVLLGNLVRAQLAPFVDTMSDRLHVSGPELFLKPSTAQDLGLVFHELATNALKYGALSSPGGVINVIWFTEEGYFHLIWRENGGPPVSAPERRGFGHMVLQSMQILECNVSLEFPAEGVVWRLGAPEALVLAEP